MKVAARPLVASFPREGPRSPGRRPRTARRRHLRGRWRARDAADGLLGSLGSEEPAGGGRGVGFFHSRSEGRVSLLLCSTPPSGRVRSVASASRSGAGGVTVVYDCVWGNPLAGSPATAATARARGFLPGGAAEDLLYPPPSQIPGESSKPVPGLGGGGALRAVLFLETPPGALWFFGRVVVRLESARRRRAQGVIFLCRVCVPAGVCLDGVMLCGGKVVVCHGGSAPEPGWRGIGFLFPLTAP